MKYKLINQKIKEMECVQMSNLKTIYYYPELREEVGSINAVIIMGYLESCFDEKGQVFYKFMEPCNHRDYVPGESCVEELGMTAAEFRTAFKYIGVVYKSKKAFNLSKDKFQGKMYLSYYDRMNKLTYYMRNDEMMNKIRKAMDEADEENETQEGIESQKVREIEEVIDTEKAREEEEQVATEEASEYQEVIEVQEASEYQEVSETRKVEQLVYRNRECLSAANQESKSYINHKSTDDKSYLFSLNKNFNTSYKDYESRDLSFDVNNDTRIMDSSLDSNDDTKIIDSSLNVDCASSDIGFVETIDNGEVPLETIKGLFNQICKSFEEIVEWTSWQKQKLEYIWVKYERDLEIFRIAFEQLEESDFLCGRKKSWKAYLGWILKPYHFADILMGKYRNYQRNAYKENGDDRMKATQYTKVESSYVDMQSHEWDFDEIERLERRRIDKILEERNATLQLC